jgi:metal-responsive CopG/Arc/MetJ family transcriptional regulator
MKIKTSVTLSGELLEELDRLGEEFQNRSEVIERALRLFLQQRLQKLREEKDLRILNQKASDLNEEAEDVLSYQVDL